VVVLIWKHIDMPEILLTSRHSVQKLDYSCLV